MNAKQYKNPLIQLFLVKLWKSILTECKLAVKNDITLLYAYINGEQYTQIYTNKILPAFACPISTTARKKVSYGSYVEDIIALLATHQYSTDDAVNKLREILNNTTYAKQGVRHFRNSYGKMFIRNNVQIPENHITK